MGLLHIIHNSSCISKSVGFSNDKDGDLVEIKKFKLQIGIVKWESDVSFAGQKITHH